MRGFRIIFFLLSSIYSAQISAQSFFELVDPVTTGGPVTYGTVSFTGVGPGISFMDFDGDGWDDISLPASGNRDFQFLRNTGGQFELISLPISSGGLQSRQVTWVDFDNDGDNDFFATSDEGRCWFYRNDGNNVFTDIIDLSGIATQPWPYWGIAWGDYDNDSYLDLYLTVRDTQQVQYNLLYHNNGNGTFTDVTSSANLHLTGFISLCASFVDYDKDGYQDIYVANDKERTHNLLYRNMGNGTFQDVSIASGTDLFMDAMSTTIDDYNNDGWLDIYVTNIYPPLLDTEYGNAFLLNNGDGTFTNIALQNGSRFDSFGWGAVFIDGENDGDLDLYVSSHLDQMDGRPQSTYFENTGQGDYVIPSDAGFAGDPTGSYGNAKGDIQNDGLADIAVINTNDLPMMLWENQSSTDNSWLKVQLQGTESNRMGIGSYIEVGAGGTTYYGYTLCGEGYISQNSTSEFFGLNDATMIDYIEVSWLSGLKDRLENIAVNQQVVIVEGSSPVDNGDNGSGDDDDDNPPSPYSVARQWNDVLLEAIRKDLARPTVHARNLFHSSLAMYDAWALFDDTAETVFLGKYFGGFSCEFNGIPTPQNIDAASEEIMSYALYRLLSHRFADSPGASSSLALFTNLFTSLGYNVNNNNTNYTSGSYAALGNYLGEQLIAFGQQDGANETSGYANRYYEPVNDPMSMSDYLDVYDLNNPNRWQPLSFENFIDQSGNPIEVGTPEFLSPEWGEVVPFALKQEDLQILNNGFDSYIYQDPGAPPEIQNGNGIADPYKWNFAMVAAWSAHLDPNDTTRIDISPGSIGNVDFSQFPQSFQDYQDFYDFTNGGDLGIGHSTNPATGEPYSPQWVKRADYARVLAEFWADGPDSETPPGHWFTILNYVNDHPETVKRLEGNGPLMEDLEWDVKSYLALGGAMHDAAVNAWAVKGFYDYIRPISAIRYMASKGQSSDPMQPSYDPHGIPLIPGFIELIEAGDPLAGIGNENVGKIKIYAWRGPDYISDPTLEIAGVDWILGTQWWPYQRPTFVTPPFAGYVSGHSTFSRAAAEVLTLFTGDAFFPGGMGIFDIEENNFLVFEQGPSENLTLQWGTYRDASDQTSLSRIWGGIHPPVDDIPGRIMGDKIGKDSYALATAYFDGLVQLRTDNFLIQVSSETCVDQNDGSISIQATDYYQYVVSMSDKEYEFTTNLTIGDLNPGSYSICIGVKGNSDAEQCFELQVKEAIPLEVTASLQEFDSQNLLTFDISHGSAPYFVEINDKPIGSFETKNFNIQVKDGDQLKLYTSRPCEGVLTENIVIPSYPLLYPNPIETEAVVQWPGESNTVEAAIFNLSGQLLSVQQVKVSGEELHIPINNLANGIYILRLKGRTTQILKLIKN